jgi:hypothetical protein
MLFVMTERVLTQVARIRVLAISILTQHAMMDLASSLLIVLEHVVVLLLRMHVETVTIPTQFLMLETLNSISQAANKPLLYLMV